MFPTFFKYGEGRLLLTINNSICQSNISILRSLQEYFFKQRDEGIRDVVIAYNSMLVTYDHRYLQFEQLEKEIESLLDSHDNEKNPNHFSDTIHLIEVDYHEGYNWDLLHVAKSAGLTPEEVIRIHQKTVYTAHFIGYLPGFLYLGGLDKKIATPRRKDPRIRIPKGAVAIGGQQTGIYPSDSPGGWHVIGQTKEVLFDASSSVPSKFSARDKIQFIPAN